MITYQDLLTLIRKEKQMVNKISKRKSVANVLVFKENNKRAVTKKECVDSTNKKDKKILVQYL